MSTYSIGNTFKPVGEKPLWYKGSVPQNQTPEKAARCAAHSERMKKLRAERPEWTENVKAARRRSKGTKGTSSSPRGVRAWQKKIFRRQARFEATLTMKKLDAAGVLEGADEQARSALHYALEKMRDMTTPTKDGLVAARLVLDFTKAKPAQKSEITISKAEEWLEAVTADASKADESTTYCP